MTVQEQMQARLAQAGIPYKEIHCYGSQIMVTAWGRPAAEKWASFLARFAKVKAMKESLDYNEENKNTVLRPTTHKVWRVWATI
jgi:hypothetical protein